MTFSELKVTIKDADKTLSTKYPLYDEYTVKEDDSVIKDCIQQTLDNFDGEPDDITVNIKLEIK
jgi:hypothetical protein